MGGANHRGAGQPPPYTTNPRRGGRGPRTRGPPPPYMSHENIAEPLIEVDPSTSTTFFNDQLYCILGR